VAGYIVATQVYWKLKTLRLSGFAFEKDTLRGFLERHKNTLVKVEFDNCSLSAPWLTALSALHDSPTLQKLNLKQISQGMQRVVWATPEVCPLQYITCYEREDGDAGCEDMDEWFYVGYLERHSVTIDFARHHIPRLMRHVFTRYRASARTTDPRRPDAVVWGMWFAARVLI
jgi:hypothetical protein